jgi:predicted AlkP superfamily phosphohydrolase/phosphomutase
MEDSSGRRLSRRTIVLGLDSVDLLLVQRWAAAGHLPFFAKLMSESPLVRLAALSRVLQGALWPSLLTGRTPGHHGLYYANQLVSGTYRMERFYADHVKLERFYERLSAHGARCAIVDVPTDLPAEHLNGVHIVDWGTEFKFWRYETRPTTLKEQLDTRLGRHFLADYAGTGGSSASHRELRESLVQAVRVKSRLIGELLDRPDLDLIFAVYGEPHKAGHFFWKYMDRSHPEHAANATDLEDSLLQIYQLIDTELAQLAERMAPSDNLIVFSDHGMQANYRGEHFMETILKRLGLCKSTSQARLGGHGQRSAVRYVEDNARQILRSVAEGLLPAQMTEWLRSRFGEAARIDWSVTQAFILPTDRNSYIRVNLQGREPQGIVTPGVQYEALMRRIDYEFRSLINVETGMPAVEEVFNIPELYAGPRSSDLPDMAILWRADAPINVLESPSVGRLEMKVSEARSGNHRAEGFLLGRGPAFRIGAGELHADLLQIAPTLLALHGVACPSTYDAGPLTELLTDAYCPSVHGRLSAP